MSLYNNTMKFNNTIRKKKIDKNVKTRKKINNKFKLLKNDTYHFFNASWLKNIKIPKTKLNINNYSILSNRVEDDISKIILSYKDSNDKTKKMCWDIYQSVINLNKYSIQEKIYDNINESINGLKYIILNKKAEDLYVFCIKNSINYPFEWNIYNDERNSNKFISYISEDGFNLPDKDYYLNNKYNEKLIRYKKFIKNVFNIVLKNNKLKDNLFIDSKISDIDIDIVIDKIIKVERFFASNTRSEYDRRISEKNYNKINIDDNSKNSQIMNKYFDWKKFSTLIGYKEIKKEYIVTDINYMKKSMEYINKNWKSDDFYYYMLYNLLISYNDIYNQINDIYFDFFEKYLNGRRYKETQHKKAINYVCYIMNTFISKEYLKKFSISNNEKMIYNMAEDIKKCFYSRLINNCWLDDNTINKAISKLNNMTIKIGTCNKNICSYKNQDFMEDPEIDYSDNFVDNILKYNNWEINEIIKMSEKNVNNNIWNRFTTSPIYTVNAFYDVINNEIIIPSGIIREPFIDKNNNYIYTLAMLGTTIGHELTHGFDDEGSKYDLNGELNSWWSKKDYSTFKNKQQEIKNVYKNVLKRDGYNDIDLNLSLGENIADIGGLLICEDLLMNYCINNKIKNKEKIFTDFYKYYCYSWREKSNLKKEEQQMKLNSHILFKYRCNCSLMFSYYFKNIFNIQEKDKMYNNNIVKMW